MPIDTKEMTCPRCGGPTPLLYDGACGDCWAWTFRDHQAPRDQEPIDDDWDGYWDESDRCHYCGGDGWGIVGCDWDCDDAINGPYPGELQRCPCCNGSGDAKDCTFW